MGADGPWVFATARDRPGRALSTRSSAEAPSAQMCISCSGPEMVAPRGGPCTNRYKGAWRKKNMPCPSEGQSADSGRSAASMKKGRISIRSESAESENGLFSAVFGPWGGLAAAQAAPPPSHPGQGGP